MRDKEERMEKREYLLEQLMDSKVEAVWKEFILSKREAIIYGAGRQARIVIDFCNMYQKKYKCLMTTDSKRRWGLLPRENELPLFLLNEFPEELSKDNYDVIIAMDARHNEEIIQLLSERGFTRIYALKNWSISNEEIKDNFYRSYFNYYGSQWFRDSIGEKYLECSTDWGVLRMYYPDDPIFKANTLGEIGNIVLPSIFGDCSVSCLGPYEYGNEIRLHKGDVVFDLGANVGLFSCVAASKGCKVYAFEPEGVPVCKYLEMNAKLNENVMVIWKAVGDKNEKVPFYYNEKFDRDLDLCRSSIHREKEPDYCEKEVEVIKLDDFVQEYGIKRVDFIKSHIEYAEHLMLKGAKKILQQFEPVLSFYSSKALGAEYKEIEKLILKANEKYKIYYEKRRLYAYVEK